jgi:hypothetical protein
VNNIMAEQAVDVMASYLLIKFKKLLLPALGGPSIVT